MPGFISLLLKSIAQKQLAKRASKKAGGEAGTDNKLTNKKSSGFDKFLSTGKAVKGFRERKRKATPPTQSGFSQEEQDRLRKKRQSFFR